MKVGPKNLRTIILPLRATIGIAVTAEDFAHGVIWGKHCLNGSYEHVYELEARAKKFPGRKAVRSGAVWAQKVKMMYFGAGERQPDIARAERVSDLLIRKVCCGMSYWWCGWRLDDLSRFKLLEERLCSMPHYRCGSLSVAIQAISTKSVSATD